MRRSRPSSVLVTLCVGVALLAGCALGEDPAVATDPNDLLGGKLPTRATGVRGAGRLTDGIVPPEGDAWQTDRTAVFTSVGAFAEYDLGTSRTIRAVYLQGDNNDRYVVEVSEDGRAYRRIFAGRAVGRPGMRARYSDTISNASGRFLKLHPESGDGSFSLGELLVYETIPSVFPPALPEEPGNPARDALELRLALLALALIGFVCLARAKSRVWNLALLALPISALVVAIAALRDTSPIDTHTVSVVRALVALVALVAVVRASVLRSRLPASRYAVTITLAFCAVTGPLAFYNLGHPQFWNAGESRPTFIHYHDMRMYYPVAKYFQELRYDGVYAASLAALADGAGPSLDRLARNEFRDMTTHRMVRVEDQRERIAEVKARFSPSRWSAFVEDMRYFHHSMGLRGYLGSMHDHGANATPVWFLFARTIFVWSHASDSILLLGAGVDLALLLLAFVVIGRTYGLRTMFVAMVVFGANDFYMFGSNWAGSTLRHDWLAYLGLGICALRVKRFTLGGALLALSAMIRAFPALALVGAAMPSIWVLVQRRRELGRWPRPAELRTELEPLLRISLGAGVCAVGFWLTSSLVLSFDSWAAWAEKILLLAHDPHVNNVSLRQLCLWARDYGLSDVGAGVFGGVVGVILGATVFVAARGTRPDQAAVLGIFLIPVVFDPSNYYLHIVYLLPLLADERPWRALADEAAGAHRGPNMLVWATVLAMCIAEYFALDLELAAHFRWETVALFSCLVLLLAIRLVRPRREEVATAASTSEPLELKEAAP